MMNQLNPLLLTTIICGTISIPGLAQKQHAQEKPNIVLILADDLGFGSLNSYGANKNLVRTPHIDRLAEQGMRFTCASTPASICTPTRYGILTGSYPWRSSLKFGVANPLDPLLIDENKISLADLLKNNGYNTAAIGKWHLGYGDKKPVDFTKKLTPGPLDIGFDYHFGVPQNHDDFTGVFVENDRVYGLRSNKINSFSKSYYGKPYLGFDAPQRENKNVMQVLTDKSIDWLKLQDGKTPFFLYFTPVAVHEPVTPSDFMRGISDCGPYGDFIQDLDLCVGRIIETLEYMGVLENTIIIFTSDNGGEIPSGDLDRPENQAIKYGLKINGDLRGDKHTIWEGGTLVPFIVSWPGKVEKSTVSNDMINLVDIFATLSEITEGQPPKSKDTAPDSFSFLPSLLKKNNNHPRTSMVTADVKGMQAIRIGDLKFIDNSLPPGFPEKMLNQYKNEIPQLYNLKDDPAEQINLYDKYPDKVKQLLDELNRIRNASSSR